MEQVLFGLLAFESGLLELDVILPNEEREEQLNSMSYVNKSYFVGAEDEGDDERDVSEDVFVAASKFLAM